MFNNARTIAFCITRSILPRTAIVLNNDDHLPHMLRRSVVKALRCRYVSSSHNELDSTSDADNFDDESPYTNVNFAKITDNDPEKIRQLKRIQLEIDMKRQQGETVPSEVTTSQWLEMLRLDTQMARFRYYHFLWLIEHKKKKKKERQIKLHQEFLKKKAAELPRTVSVTTRGPIIYSLGANSIFWRISDGQMRLFYNLKLMHASMYNPHIIVDCGYEPFMTMRNLGICAKQILFMWSENRYHSNPFHLVFCNLSRNSELFARLSKTLKTIDEPDFPFYYTPKHYLDVYPKEKLVYLTPHCTEELDEYNHEDTYIIGGFVDRNKCEPLSLAKAKKEGLRMARFPLDKYLRWQTGIKSLTLNHSLAIMNDLKDTNNWRYALQNVPARKTRSEDDDNEEQLGRMSNYSSAKVIREQYRRNLVYDLLMKETEKIDSGGPSEKT